MSSDNGSIIERHLRAALATQTGESFPSRYRTAGIDGDWKLLRNGAASAWQLYDLRTDPGERVDRFAAEPEVARRVARPLHRMRAESGELAVRFPTGKALSTPQIDAELRSLGYLK